MTPFDAPKNPYSYLERLSTSTLEEIISSDYNGTGFHDDELIFAVLEVLKNRKQREGQLPDIDSAWSKFQEYYDTADMSDISLYGDSSDLEQFSAQPLYSVSSKNSGKKIFRRIVTVAATLTILLCSAIAVQAAGIDIFGSLAMWTEETFHFVSSSNRSNSNETALTNALIEAKIPKTIAPTWFPNGFAPDNAIIYQDTDFSSVSVTFWNGSKSISCNIDWYIDESLIDTVMFEKDNGPVEVKEINGVQYYIMSNNDAWITAWQKGNHVGFVGGDISYDDLIRIIDSMEEF